MTHRQLLKDKMTISSILTKHFPKYEITIPSTGESVWFRPFLVKEEKKLLIVQEFGTEKEIIKAIIETLESCFEYNKIHKLPIFDIEYLFIQLRSKSIGSLMSPTITCPYTQEAIEISIDLNELNVIFNETHSKIIELGHNTQLKMKYPSIDILVNSAIKTSDESIYKIALYCMDTIQTDTELINCELQNKEELEEFLDNMSASQFEKVTHFFNTMPKIEKTITYITSDSISRTITLKGIRDFFF